MMVFGAAKHLEQILAPGAPDTSQILKLTLDSCTAPPENHHFHLNYNFGILTINIHWPCRYYKRHINGSIKSNK